MRQISRQVKVPIFASETFLNGEDFISYSVNPFSFSVCYVQFYVIKINNIFTQKFLFGVNLINIY